MFSTLAKFVGQCVGEVVHQSGEILADIAKIPEALAQGYEEELFEAKPTKPKDSNIEPE